MVKQRCHGGNNDSGSFLMPLGQQWICQQCLAQSATLAGWWFFSSTFDAAFYCFCLLTCWHTNTFGCCRLIVFCTGIDRLIFFNFWMSRFFPSFYGIHYHFWIWMYVMPCHHCNCDALAMQEITTTTNHNCCASGIPPPPMCMWSYHIKAQSFFIWLHCCVLVCNLPLEGCFFLKWHIASNGNRCGHCNLLQGCVIWGFHGSMEGAVCSHHVHC